jgi:glycosyltransferase involved in cell wall biosynthesis
MRVLMLNPFYLPYQGGTEKHLAEVCPRLVRKGFEVAVATAQLPGTPREEVLDGVRVFRSKARVLERLPKPLPPPVPVSLTMGRDIEKLAPNYDAVHLHNRFFYGFLDLAKLKRKARVKVGLTLHNARPQGIDFATDLIGGLYDDTVGRRIMKHADRIAGVSQNTLDVTVPRKYRAKTQVIYNGVDTKVFRPGISGGDTRRRLGLDGHPVVMTNVRLVPQKGVRYLLAAAALARREVSGLRVLVFGRGPLEGKLRAEAARLGLGDAVVFHTQRVSDEELAGLYAACDVFVLPSVWEPFGMALVEAMACGKPVVGTRVGGIPEIVTPECGYLVGQREAGPLADRLVGLLKDERLRRRMGEAARRRVETTFTWDHAARAYEEFYRRLAEA